MKKNPLSNKQWSKLVASISWSERNLEFPKRKRLQSIRQVIGYHYMEGGNEFRVPVPMLALATQIYIRLLTPKNPRCLINTSDPSLKPTAANLELAVNQIPKEIYLSDTIRKMVMEALFSVGVVKIGIYEVGTQLGHKVGKTFVDNVSLDNYFLDMSAKSFDEIDYEGNQYWRDYDEVMDSDWLPKKVRDELKPDEYTLVGPAGEPRAEEISSDESADQYRDRVWLRDLWLPKEGLLITMTTNTNTFLKAVEWEGPKCGPYVKLGFIDVPGNLLPMPPVSLWRDLHELSNKIFRKIGQQAEDAKSVQAFQGGDEESVNNYKAAKDGEGIRYTGAAPITLSTPGVDAKSLAFYLQCRDLFSYFAGNLDSLGGLGNQAPTLGQDKLLNLSASAQMADMSDRVAETVKEIFQALAFYEWGDPTSKRVLDKPIPGLEGKSLPVKWNHQSKRGNFEAYKLDIDVYSLQDNSPGARLQKLQLMLKEFVMPFMQQIQQGHGTVDIKKILELAGKYSDFPEIQEIVKFAEKSQDQMQQQQQGGQPADTSHTSVRVGQPGQSREGGDQQMMQTLMGPSIGSIPSTPAH